MAVLPNYTTFRQRFSVSGTVDTLTGYEEWPLAAVRASGFTILNVKRPIVTPTFTVTCNPTTPASLTGNNDAVPGVDEYDWYVSQRTDDPADQCLSVAHAAGKSGTLQFGVTARAGNLVKNIHGSYILSDLERMYLYRNVWLYVQRKSDNAVQLVELLPASML